MKAITLHEPWASLIREGKKTVETRSWPAPRPWGRRIGIHAGKKVDREFLRSVSPMPVHPGRMVATAILGGCYRVYGHREVMSRGEPRWAAICYNHQGEEVLVGEDRYGDFSIGRWLWLLTDIQPLEYPVLAVGHQGFWVWDDPMGLFRKCECGHDSIRHIVGDDRMERCEDCACIMFMGADGKR